MKLLVTEHATIEPVTVAQARAYCKVTHQLEDSIFTGLVSTARIMIEEASRTPISKQTFQAIYTMPTANSTYGLRGGYNDPDDVLLGVTIPRTPIVNLSKVELVEGDTGVIKELATSDYSLVGDKLRLKTPRDYMDCVELIVTFEAGWLPSDVNADEEPTTDCPAIMRQCVLDTVAYMYVNRGQNVNALPKNVVTMMRSFARPARYAG